MVSPFDVEPVIVIEPPAAASVTVKVRVFALVPTESVGVIDPVRFPVKSSHHPETEPEAVTSQNPASMQTNKHFVPTIEESCPPAVATREAPTVLPVPTTGHFDRSGAHQPPKPAEVVNVPAKGTVPAVDARAEPTGTNMTEQRMAANPRRSRI
jgi:hypothetical protein